MVFRIMAALLFAVPCCLATGLEVTESARFDGTYGLRVSLEQSGPFFLHDDSLEVSDRLRVRFYFRLQSLDLPINSELVVFAAADTSGQIVLKLVLEKENNTFLLSWQTLLDSGTTMVSENSVMVVPGWHGVELEWLAAEDQGLVRSWLDGVAGPASSGLANGMVRAASAMLGAVAQTPPPGSSGYFDLDAFELRQVGEIGEICYSLPQWRGALARWPNDQNVFTLLGRIEKLCF